MSTYNITSAALSGHLADGFIAENMNSTTNRTIRAPEGWFNATYRAIPYFVRQDLGELNAGDGGVITNTKDLVCRLDPESASSYSARICR